MDVSGAGKALEGSGYGCEQLLHGINVTEISRMTKEQKTKRIERDIRALAALDQPRVPTWGTKHFRKRRATPPSADPELKENEERINGVLFETLQPYAFTAEVAEGAALEVVTLSPEAFINEILFPRALRLEVLSPRAFIAAVLSPNALIARILSPTAFRVEVLSPRALHTWVLSPEVFVLSPHILGGAHSHEEAEHTVSEIGAHSDHIHGDEEHERAEGSHHSHEIEEETVSGLPRKFTVNRH
ncbi:hypothetical protein RB195_016674 [Necator americanus]|uniref:Uncharacterized protein n=1 Tax=Necator americanus TaxID=51031 RepID=A0ABR1C4S5_NECAM